MLAHRDLYILQNGQRGEEGAVLPPNGETLLCFDCGGRSGYIARPQTLDLLRRTSQESLPAMAAEPPDQRTLREVEEICARVRRHFLQRELRPGERWTHKRVEHLIVAVRARLSKGGVRGLTREEVGEPVGNALNHNLIRELMESTSIVPPDLDLISLPDEPGD